MGALIMAWIVGEGIVIYRTAKANKAPPGPGQLIYSSGVFVMLALLAESNRARSLAVTLAWGFDIAAFIALFQNPPKASTKNTWPPGLAPNTLLLPDGSGTDISQILNDLANGATAGAKAGAAALKKAGSTTTGRKSSANTGQT